MPRSSAGKWVARAGATGHSRTYRGQTPVNWYAGLVVIVLLGILSVLWASYVYRHPASAATSTTNPTTSTSWFAGINFDGCGTTLSPLASNASTASKSGKGIFTTGSGVITVAPKTDKQAGKNAVLGKFVSGYPGLTLTATKLVVPGTKAASYENGEKCPKGTPDAGKIGEVHVVYWTSAFNTSAKSKAVIGDPSTLRFSDNQLITVGFVPTGTNLGKNSGVVTALLHSTTGTSTSSTATTAPTATSTPTSTSAPASTSTSTPSSSSTPTTTKK